MSGDRETTSPRTGVRIDSRSRGTIQETSESADVDSDKTPGPPSSAAYE